MKFIRLTALVLAFFLLIWIDLPENVRVGPYRLQPLTINTSVFGLRINKEFKTHLGLDLRGGSHLVFEAETEGIKTEDLENSLNGVRDIIERRVNMFGIAESQVSTLQSGDSYRIVVDLPGVSDVDEAVTLIGQTAQLTFREVASAEGGLATNSALLVDVTHKTELTGADVKRATLDFSGETGEPVVALEFTQAGGQLFADITSRNVGKPVGIFLDEGILSAPIVQQPILDGRAIISGQFTQEDAKQLAVAINSGALPVPIELIEQRNIGPSLGAVEVEKSIFAGVVGLTAVGLFMILYYGKLGVIATVALIIYGLIALAIFRAIPIVLTLPGVAGFILSIGMAVDANILIFERIREELRAGKPHDIAIRLGFGRAIDAIKDANFTTLLISFILFNPLNWSFLPQFGLVRGFALTLAIGVVTSLFTGVFITQRLIKLFYKK